MPDTHVFFIPGITGSYLVRQRTYGLRITKNVWPDPISVIEGAFGEMTLTVPGEQGGHPPGFILGGGPLVHYYSGWLDAIRKKGYQLATIKQDWRREWVYDGATLAEAIREVTDLTTTPPVTCAIIAHSRGGLVTRWALELLRQTGELARVRLVFGLGVPHRGSVLAVDNLNGPWQYASDLHRLGDLTTLVSRGAVSYASVQGALRSWPGLYELMPDPVRTWLSPIEVAKLYVKATWGEQKYPVVPEHLASALASWAVLPDPPSGVQWVNVVGVGFATRYGALTAEEMIAHESVIDPTGGDGVVPVASAQLAGRETIWTPTSHGAMGYDSRLIEFVTKKLSTQNVAGYALAGAALYVPDGTTQGPA